MRKLFLILLVLPIMSFASTLDMSTLRCRDMHLTNMTTLADVQNSCLISEQSGHNGLFEVQFINDATTDTVKCSFASNMPTARLNGCK